MAVSFRVLPSLLFHAIRSLQATGNFRKTYLNILFFDEGFNFICEQSQYVQLSVMGSTQTVTILGSSMIVAPANGYAYIYVSNESRNPVFIDNFQVVHQPGRIVQDVSYYPFGLVQAGISSSAANITPNKEKTFQGQRFDDDFGINYVQFKYRSHDPQIGRFIQIDPLADKYVHNSTYAFSENKVTGHVELEGLESVSINPTVDFFVNKAIEWTIDLKQGAQNFRQGAVEKATAVTGGNDYLPTPVQQIKSVSADLQMNAGIAQMVKPGLEAASYVGGIASGLEIPSSPGMVTASNFGLKGSVSLSRPTTLGGIANPIPNEVSRVIPISIGEVKTLGIAGTKDVFVTASSDIQGLSSAKIAQKLAIPKSSSGFRVIMFPTPEGIASPVNRNIPGFIGGGRTAGGAREFVIPNTTVPKDAKIKIVN